MKLMKQLVLLRFLVANLLFYLPVRFIILYILRFFGQKQLVVGKCTIFAPPTKMQIISEGIAYLQVIDKEMFLRLTAERRYIFWYHKRQFIECREIFTINDNYLQWGKEGVVACFVQAIMDFNLRYLPFEKSMFNRHTVVENRQNIQKQVYEFANKHSFSTELVEFYRKEATPPLFDF